jgi:hypothetical protein
MSVLAKLSVGFLAVGTGLDMVMSSMFPMGRRGTINEENLFFRSDRDALCHDWKCICGDMQAVCQDLKDGASHVF